MALRALAVVSARLLESNSMRTSISGSVVAVGGNANNSVKAGAFYVNSNNDSSNDNSNIGSRLSLSKPYARVALPLGRTQSNASLRFGTIENGKNRR
jgi:hypothetical protein